MVPRPGGSAGICVCNLFPINRLGDLGSQAAEIKQIPSKGIGERHSRACRSFFAVSSN
jgi:hypothetical protein